MPRAPDDERPRKPKRRQPLDAVVTELAEDSSEDTPAPTEKRKRRKSRAAVARRKARLAAETPDERAHRLRGLDLVRGNPGNSGGKKGRSGRRPDWFKRYAEQLLANPSTKRSVRRILRAGPLHPGFLGLYKELTNRAFGQAKAHLDVKASLTLEDLLSASQSDPDADEED